MTTEFWNQKIETMPLNELKDLQFKRLRRLIEYIYNNNKYQGIFHFLTNIIILIILEVLYYFLRYKSFIYLDF